MDRYSHWDFIPSLVYSGVWFMLGSVEIGFTAIMKKTGNKIFKVIVFINTLYIALLLTFL
jgi:hypothetical protein